MTYFDYFESKSALDIVDYTISKYCNDQGEQKFKKVYEKVMTSNKLSGLISTSKYKNAPINSTLVLSAIAETPYFLFKSNWTHVCAAVLFFLRWNEEVNSIQFLLSPLELRHEIIMCFEHYKDSL